MEYQRTPTLGDSIVLNMQQMTCIKGPVSEVLLLCQLGGNMRFEVLDVVKKTMLVFWVVMPHGQTENLLPPSLSRRWIQFVSLKYWYLPTTPHGVSPEQPTQGCSIRMTMVSSAFPGVFGVWKQTGLVLI
jgi:hypothetical protein